MGHNRRYTAFPLLGLAAAVILTGCGGGGGKGVAAECAALHDASTRSMALGARSTAPKAADVPASFQAIGDAYGKAAKAASDSTTSANAQALADFYHAVSTAAAKVGGDITKISQTDVTSQARTLAPKAAQIRTVLTSTCAGSG